MRRQGKVRVWVWLIPVYILVALPLIKWTMKIYSPDLRLSKDELSAFSGQGKVEKDDYKFHEPSLNDLGYAVHYRTQGSSMHGEDYDRKVAEAETEGEREIAEKNAAAKKASAKKTEPAAGAYQKNDEYAKEADEARKGKMMSVGFKAGFLTESVSGLMKNPKAVSALFNNSYVVKGFMGRDTVKNALANPQALQKYLSNTSVVSNFLGNSVVKAALNNPEVVNAVATSALGSTLLNSPAVQGLIKNPDALNNLITNNPQAAQLLANPNITAALMNNPDAAAALARMQTGKAGK